jgi:hypothetical protein
MSLIIRYCLVGVAIGASFLNFISCGSQMYKASLADDHEPSNRNGGSADFADPNSPEFGLHAPKGWVSTPIQYTVETGLDAVQLAALQNAMATWEKATGKKLFSFVSAMKNKQGAEFPDLTSALSDGFNGNYDQPSWGKSGKKTEVLATAIWVNYGNDYNLIEKADLHYNSEYYMITDALTQKPVDQREIVDMQTLALHELGHLLGLAHVVDTEDSSSIMNPSMYIGEGLATRSLSVGDVTRIQKIYGCSGKSCDKTAITQEILLSANSSKAH